MNLPVKIEFKDYPSGSWQNWSEYLANPPRINKRVESDNEGEAGVITFDNASVSFYYVSGNPVYSAFSIDLSAKQRYYFRISIPKSNGTYVTKFYGIADFSSIEWPDEPNVEIQFDIVDKLTSLGILPITPCRTGGTLNSRILSQLPNAVYLRCQNIPDTLPFPTNCDTLRLYASDSGGNELDFTEQIIFPGELIQNPETWGATPEYYFVRNSYLALDNNNKMVQWVELSASIYAEHDYAPPGSSEPLANNTINYLDKELYGIDINIYDAGDGHITALDGLKVIEALYKQLWPDDLIVNLSGVSQFLIPDEYGIRLQDNAPFGNDPLAAMKTLTESMECYVYVNSDGNLVIQSKKYIGTNGVTRSIGGTFITKKSKKYFWDKLIDGVTVNVKSWLFASDGEFGNYLEGSATITKQFSSSYIEPKNKITKDILTTAPSDNTIELLNAKAATKAQNILSFYGLRRASIHYEFDLDDNTIDWDILDNVTIDVKYFFTALEIDCAGRRLSLDLVEVSGHEYDVRQVVVGLSDNNLVTTGSSSNVIGGGSGGSSSYIFAYPLEVSAGIVSLLYTGGFKLTGNQLDLNRNVNTNAPLTGGGNLDTDRTLGLSYNATNLKLTINALNTIQDIATTSSPTFNQVTLSSAGGANQAVRTDRQILVSAPITGGGNLLADRTIGLNFSSPLIINGSNQLALDYNTTNLRLTLNKINTIQDINTAASPAFVNVKLSALTDNYIPYHITDASGFGNSPIYTNGTNLAIGTASLFEKINLGGNLRHYGNYSFFNNFISGWTGTGWRLDYGVTNPNTATFEVDDLWVRGTMNVYELLINQIRATNGSLFVSSAARVKTYTGGSPEVVLFEDVTGHNITPFAVGDIIMIQKFSPDSLTVVKRIVRKIVILNALTATLQVLPDGPSDAAVIEPGDDFVRIGNIDTVNYPNRQGSIYLTSDDSNSPFIDIIDGVTSWSDWTDPTKNKGRIGRLSGISASPFGQLDGYGVYTQNAYLYGNVNVFGTISAGDAYGFDSVFYAGRIDKNQFKKSEDALAGDAGYALFIWTSGGATWTNTKVSVLLPGGRSGNVTQLKKTSSTGSAYLITDGDLSRCWVGTQGEFDGKVWTISFWAQATGAATAGDYTFIIEYPEGTTKYTKQYSLVVGEWQRLTFLIDNYTGGGYPKISAPLKYSASYSLQLYGFQLEAGVNATAYQPTDGNTIQPSAGYGMWAKQGGFGGTLQNPRTSIVENGLIVRSGGTGSATWLGTDTISIGYSSAEWGIIGKSGSDKVFQLGSINNIAGWTINADSISKDNVSLKANSSLRGLLVYDTRELVKIGQFTHGTLTGNFININTQALGYSLIDPDDVNWQVSGLIFDDKGVPHTPTLNFSTYSGQNIVVTNSDGYPAAQSWDFSLFHTVLDPKLFLGRRIKLEYIIRFSAIGFNQDGGTFITNIKYKDSGGNTIFYDSIYTQTIPTNTGSYITINKTGISAITRDFPYYANCTAIEINFNFSGGAQVGSYNPQTMDCTQLTVTGYDGYTTYISQDGFEVYNGPTTYFRFANNKYEIAASDLKVSGLAVPRFHGRLSAAPVINVQVGDFYVNSSSDLLWVCYYINNLGVASWRSL